MAVDKHAVNEKVQQYVKKGQWQNAVDEMRKLLAEDKNDPMVTLHESRVEDTLSSIKAIAKDMFI